jgi:hypothetical protein
LVVVLLAFALVLGGIAACGGHTTTTNLDSGKPDGGRDSTVDASIADASSSDAPPDTDADASSASSDDAALDAPISGDADASAPPDSAATDASDAASAIDGTAPGADASSDADAQAWTPNAILSRVAFWFDPTSLVALNGRVAKWVDLSGKGNHAVQGTTAYQPTYTANGIGGLPSASFAGPVSFLSIADGSSMQWGTDDYALFAVFRASAQSQANSNLYQKVNGASPWPGAALMINYVATTSTTLAASYVRHDVYVVSAAPPATFDDFTVHLLTERRAVLTLDVRVDGRPSASVTNANVGAVDVSGAGYPATIGQNGYQPTTDFQQLYGDIAEMIAVRGALTDTELASLEQYLKDRYAIP